MLRRASLAHRAVARKRRRRTTSGPRTTLPPHDLKQPAATARGSKPCRIRARLMACSGNSVRRLTTIVWRSASMDSWFTSHRRYVRTSRTAPQSFRSWSCKQQGRSARHLSLFAATALAATLVAVAPALGHGFAGKRFFPATLATDDPFVADELSLPTISSRKLPGDD